MGTAGAKAFGDTLLVNKTIQTLDVSENSFGKPVVGDQVKLKSSGEMKVVIFLSLPLRTMVHSVWFVFRASATAFPPSGPSLFPEASSCLYQE